MGWGAVKAWREGSELGMGQERATRQAHERRKERSKGKGRKSVKKGERDRPRKWKGMGSHCPSLVLLTNFSSFW